MTFIEILPPSAFYWAMSKKQMLDGRMYGWMDVWMDGYLIPVNCRAPCGANNWILEQAMLKIRLSNHMASFNGTTLKVRSKAKKTVETHHLK